MADSSPLLLRLHLVRLRPQVGVELLSRRLWRGHANHAKDDPMAKEMRCADVGMDCDFVASAENTEQLMEQVVAHAAQAHGITEITPELAAKVSSVIRDTSAEA